MGNPLITIPLCQLKRCKSNVRKTDVSVDIEQMAASIEANGVLENLIVRRTQISDAEQPERYEVVAGSRRLAALKLLAKRKKFTRDYMVPCLVLETDCESTLIEVSLTENIVRAPVHPADQFDAFSKLQKEGLPAEDIAARFGLSTNVVLQRLKLAAVSPRLMTEYRSGAMSLEQLMAFTISDDHKAQEAVWVENPFLELPAQSIRRLLTKSLVEGGDRRARFIGAKAYVLLSLEFDGSLNVVRGLVKREERNAVSESVVNLDDQGGARKKPAHGYSDSLLVELSAHRTAALQEALAGQPDWAIIALLHTLILRIFFGDNSGACIEIAPASIDLGKASQTVGESRAAMALAARHDAWVARLVIWQQKSPIASLPGAPATLSM